MTAFEQAAGAQVAVQCAPEERARRERLRVSGGGFTGFQLSRDGRLAITELSGRVFAIDLGTAKATQVAGPDAQGRAPFDAHLSPDGAQLAFVRGGELWVAK